MTLQKKSANKTMAKVTCEMSLTNLKAEHFVGIVNLSLVLPNVCLQRQLHPQRHCYCLSTVSVYDISISKPFDCTDLWLIKLTNHVSPSSGFWVPHYYSYSVSGVA